MILIEEAVSRLNANGQRHGVSVKPWPRRSKQRRHLHELEEMIAPLRIPIELRAFWNTWDPGSLTWPCLDGLHSLSKLTDRYQAERPLSPAILLPIADWADLSVWVELATATHPGGRVFRASDTESHVDLWSFDISGFLTLLADAFEADMIDDVSGGLHQSHFEALATRSVREYVSAASPRRIESVDRSRFPGHWLSADGLPADHFNLRGATHTVEEFKASREEQAHVRATLRGHYQNTICGGPIRGCIGNFGDDTGTLQVFVPLLAGLAGAIGQDGHVELDVLSFAAKGETFDGLAAKDEMQRAADMGVADLGNDLVLRLAEQMKDLDTSVVVTGLRPIR